MKADADVWVRETEGRLDRGEDPKRARATSHTTFGELIDQHITDLTTYGKPLRRSKDGTLARLKRELGQDPLGKLTREHLVAYGRRRRAERPSFFT